MYLIFTCIIFCKFCVWNENVMLKTHKDAIMSQSYIVLKIGHEIKTRTISQNLRIARIFIHENLGYSVLYVWLGFSVISKIGFNILWGNIDSVTLPVSASHILILTWILHNRRHIGCASKCVTRGALPYAKVWYLGLKLLRTPCFLLTCHPKTP